VNGGRRLRPCLLIVFLYKIMGRASREVGNAPTLRNKKQVTFQGKASPFSNDLRRTSHAAAENVTCLNRIIGRIYTVAGRAPVVVSR
jgi:hypothetical protein